VVVGDHDARTFEVAPTSLALTALHAER